jgi:hypothetical protein
MSGSTFDRLSRADCELERLAELGKRFCLAFEFAMGPARVAAARPFALADEHGLACAAGEGDGVDLDRLRLARPKGTDGDDVRCELSLLPYARFNAHARPRERDTRHSVCNTIFLKATDSCLWPDGSKAPEEAKDDAANRRDST